MKCRGKWNIETNRFMNAVNQIPMPLVDFINVIFTSYAVLGYEI